MVALEEVLEDLGGAHAVHVRVHQEQHPGGHHLQASSNFTVASNVRLKFPTDGQALHIF